MKKTILILLSIIIAVMLIFYGFIVSKGYEIPKKDQHPEMPYFPKISDSVNYSNQVLDSMYVLNHFANSKTIFLNYTRSDRNAETKFIAILNQSFKNILHRKIEKKDHFRIDTLNQSLYFIKRDSTDKISKIEIIDLVNGKSNDMKKLSEKTYLDNKAELILLKHSTNANNDTYLLLFKNPENHYFFMEGEEANKTAKNIDINRILQF